VQGKAQDFKSRGLMYSRTYLMRMKYKNRTEYMSTAVTVGLQAVKAAPSKSVDALWCE
jgi:hypothetical protein